jgi:hypothetical protein
MHAVAAFIDKAQALRRAFRRRIECVTLPCQTPVAKIIRRQLQCQENCLGRRPRALHTWAEPDVAEVRPAVVGTLRSLPKLRSVTPVQRLQRHISPANGDPGGQGVVSTSGPTSEGPSGGMAASFVSWDRVAPVAVSHKPLPLKSMIRA